MLRNALVVAALCVCLPALARGQTLTLHTPLKAGDCAVYFDAPPGTKAAGVTITINGAPLSVTITAGTPFVAQLGEPLTANLEVAVKVGESSASAPVQAVSGGPAVDTVACPAKTAPFDERGVFEASGFLGEVFDNFAPKIDGGYANDASAATINHRITAGVEAQYRLIGNQQDDRQLWIAAHTLHGMRTADANCTDIAACEKDQGSAAATFKYILAHASTIEANVDARFEFLTVQKTSEVPAKVYVFARAGFLDLEGAPQVYDADSVGAGVIAPKGVFRNSYAQVGWGVSKQYVTDEKLDRLKINGVLVFDLMPNITTSNFIKDLGAGTRFFIAISIDRNVRTGPDAVQTYIGADFDLRRIFGSF